jgi:glycosyltransferase involved in cell wall biosynthesis
MKILLVNKYDISGGAGRAVYRLHKALLSEGVDSKILVDVKDSNNDSVILSKYIFSKFTNRLRNFLDSFLVRFYTHRLSVLFSPSYLLLSNTIKKINKIDADIVHLNWVNAGMLNIGSIKKINKPIVWTMHDMWLFTGGCHYSLDCKNYELQCNNCNILNSKKGFDLSGFLFKAKRKMFEQKKDISIVGVSNWLSKCAKESTLLKNHKIITIPNALDTDFFKKVDKNLAREFLKLPKNKKLILFGAVDATKDIRKGFLEWQFFLVSWLCS